MVVNKIFSKVNYPKNKEDIKTIFKEYDKYLNDNYENKKASGYSKNEYIFSFMLLMLVLCTIKFGDVSSYIKLIYIVPSLICLIYNLIIFRKIKKNNFNDKKLICKKNIISIFMFVTFTFRATFIMRAIIFPKWSDKEYLVCIGILVISFVVSIILNNIVAPKKFLQRFLYNSKKYKPTSITLVNSIVIILVVIFNITKPYGLLLFICYFSSVLFFQLAIYLMYIYNQYSFIEKYKEGVK